MANLFFIHTPLQLMIAQMIIEQEKLTNNVMLCGYVGGNRHFLKIYDYIRQEDMWSFIESMDDVSRWAVFSRKQLLSGTYKVFLRYQYICRVVKKHKISTLFLGDMKNGSCQLTAMSFHRKGMKICFFEEGAGHYIHNSDNKVEKNFVDKCFSFLIDFLYYRPFYGICFASFKYREGAKIELLPMDVRYSIVPFYSETIDRLITCRLQIPNRVYSHIKEEIGVMPDTGNNILLLTSPFYVYKSENDDPTLYIKIIIDTLCHLNSDTHIWIKFHPREKKNVVDIIRCQLDILRVNYHVLGSELNLPVEYYLQMIHFDEVIMFLCSSSFYNGYLFPKTKFTSIIRPFYELCKAEGSELAKYLEYLV